MSNHAFFECFSDCLKCPPGTPCHRHRTQVCVYKPIFRKQGEIGTKSERQAIATPSELPVFRLDDLTALLNVRQFATLKLLPDTLDKEQTTWQANEDA